MRASGSKLSIAAPTRATSMLAAPASGSTEGTLPKEPSKGYIGGDLGGVYGQ